MRITLEAYLPGGRTPDTVLGPEMHRMAELLEAAARVLRNGCVTTHLDMADGAQVRGRLVNDNGETAWPIWTSPHAG